MPWKLLILFLFVFNNTFAQDLDWVKAVSADSTASVSKIEITPENDVIIFGYGIGKFGGLPDNGFSGNSDYYYTFLAKYKPDGEQLWSFITNNDSIYIHDFKLDSAGNIYICGNYTDTLDKNPIAFITKMNSDKQVLWKREIKRTYLESILQASSNEVTVTSYSKHKNIEIETENGYQSFEQEYKRNYTFIKYSPEGELKGAQFIGGDAIINRFGFNVKTSKNAIYLLAEIYDGFIDLETGAGKTITTSQNWPYNSLILAKYTKNGEFEWMKVLKKENQYSFNWDFKFDLDDNENIVLAGAVSGRLDIDFSENEYIVNQRNHSNVYYFIARYDENLNLKWARSSGSTNNFISTNNIDVMITAFSLGDFIIRVLISILAVQIFPRQIFKTIFSLNMICKAIFYLQGFLATKI